MKRNFPVNIQGNLFNIDEDAFELLNRYLDSIRRHFSGTDGAGEIFQDIESRVAEMLSANTAGQNHVVTIAEVEKVIETMGKPSEIAGDNQPDENPTTEESGTKPKRLFRDMDNKIIGGVSSGMAAYFNSDPLWFRLGFIATFFFAGPLIYIAFWISMPAARTTAEKLEMRGEPVNVANIEKSIRDEFNDIADRIKERTSRSKKKGGSKLTSLANSGLQALGQVLVRTVLIFIGLLLFVIGLSLVAALIAAVFFPSIHLAPEMQSLNLQDLLGLIYQDNAQVSMMIWGIVLMISVPALLLIHGAIKMIFNLKYKAHYLGQIAGGLFLIGLIFTIITNVRLADEFKHEAVSKEEHAMILPKERTVYLTTDELIYPDSLFYNHGTRFRSTSDGLSLLQYPEIDVRRSNDDSVRVKIVRKSRGASPQLAGTNGEGIYYPVSLSDSTLYVPSTFYLDAGKPWRYPQLRVVMELPVGSIVKVDAAFGELMDEGENWMRFPSGFAGKSWVMTNDRGLVQMN